MDASTCEVGDRGSLSSWHCYIGIPINFQEVSSIVTFSSIELCAPLEVTKVCVAPCPDEAEI